MLATFTNTDAMTVELPASVRFTSAAAREFGSASVFVPYASPAFNTAYLNHDGGSLVELRDPNLGVWRGITQKPDVGPEGAQVPAIHIAKWLDLRRVSEHRVFVGLTAGVIVRQALSDGLVGISRGVLRLGTFVEAAPIIDRYEFSGQTVYSVLTDMMEATGQEWALSDDGAVSWVPRIGTLYRRLLCTDGDLKESRRTGDVTERIASVRAVDPAGRTIEVTSGEDAGFWPRQERVTGPSLVAAVRAAEVLLSQHRHSPVTFTAKLLPAGRTGTATYAAVIKAQGGAKLIARMNAQTGTTEKDISGNGNDLTYHGGVTLGQPSLVPGDGDASVLLDGSTGYLSAADSNSLDLTTIIAMECVIRRTALGACTLIDKGAGAYRLAINSSNQIEFSVPGGTTLATSSIAIDDFLPHHIMVSRILGVAWYVVIDGRDVTVLGSDTAPAANTSLLYIGATAGTSAFFGGFIDEVAITSTLSDNTTAALHYDAYRGTHAQNIRPGDFIQSVLPKAGLTPQAPLLRVLAMAFDDRQAEYDLGLQYVPPIDATTVLRAFMEGGASAPAPPPPPATDIAPIINLTKDAIAALNGHVEALKDQQTKDIPASQMTAGIVTAYNAKSGYLGTLFSGPVAGTGVKATGDPGGVAGHTTLTNVENTGTVRSTGIGTIKFADGTSRDCIGFAKIYLGTTAYYVPVFDSP